jgi:leader peptidase (prepilin peptidase)/N-methyltransferase
MVFFVNFIVFLFGLIVGSFLNCVIYRLSLPNFSLKSLSGLKNRSYCPHCKHLLSWQDLIPVFSFIFLKGKCRYCQKPISLQYPIVEISTGLIFLLIFNFQLPSVVEEIYLFAFNFLNLIYYWTITSFLIVIFVYDLKHYIIPDQVIYPAILVSGIWYLVSGIFFNLYTLDTIYSAIGAAVFFLAIVLISRGKWMGVGDIKLSFFMGLILSWPNILFALFLAFFIGAAVGIGLIISNKKTLKSEIPFGPFLVTGTFLALFWGNELISWYQGLFLL